MASNGNRLRSGRFLPPDPRVEEPYRLTPQLALRIGILAAVALGAFGVLFLRLWALQVLSSPEYVRAAEANQLRTVRVPAPRGTILDRNGHVLVTNRATTAVHLWPANLPRRWHAQRAEIQRLARVLDVPVRRIFAGMKEREGNPLDPVVVKEGVTKREVQYLKENQAEFPGVEIADTFTRHYKFGLLAAHVLGSVGEIRPDQLERLRRDGYRLGDKIGQAGIEASYDRLLRGKAGLARLRVDSLGRPLGELEDARPAVAGNAVRLTLDINLQRAAEQAIRDGIAFARADGEWAANGGAIVALDPRDGAIRAIASNPTYHPNVYSGRVTRRRLAEWGLTPGTAAAYNYPAINRALAGEYPPGSTIKPVTALAALQEHLIGPYTYLPCTPSFKAFGQSFLNWNPYFSQSIDLREALEVSCDTFFYQLGMMFYALPAERGQPLQRWASRFGFGRIPDADVGPQSAGVLPTYKWKKETFEGDPVEETWKPGNSIQLTIGQEYIRTTPLQMARFYALIANGGHLVQPHIAEQAGVAGDGGKISRVLWQFSPRPTGAPLVDPAALDVVRDGLFAATHGAEGTATPVFGNYPIPIAGKTGTAEMVVQMPGYPNGLLRDQSWWCGYGPHPEPGVVPRLVVCALIENGGHGGTAAAPAAFKVFQRFFNKAAETRPSERSD